MARIDPKYLPLAVTIALFFATATYGSIAYTGFLSPQVFLNLLIDNAFLCIVAVGMTFVILSGGIDLSVGSVIALTTMVCAFLVEKHEVSPAVVIPLVLVMGTAFGAVMGWLIERFRLSQTGPVPDGVGQERTVPVFLRVTRSFGEQASLHLFLGALVAGQLRVENSSGDRLQEEDFDPAPFVGLTFTARF